MSVRVLVPLLLVLAGGGFVLGRYGERLLGALGEARSAQRPPELEALWRLLERDDPSFSENARALAPEAMPSPVLADEARLLAAIARGAREAVADLAERGRGRPLGAQALAWLIDTAPGREERARWEDALARHYPDSWRVRRERRVRPASGGG